MRLSRKFDIYTISITAIFIIVFFVSFNTISHLTSETSKLLDISYEFDYMTRLKNSLTDLEHSIEHYLHILPGKGYSDAVMSGLSDFEKILEESDNIKLDDEELENIRYAKENFKEFSLMLQNITSKEGRIIQEDIDTYQKWRISYITKILIEIDKHWFEDLEKVNMLYASSNLSKEKSLWILLTTAAAMFLILISSRIMVSRIVVKPVKIIEEASDAIAKGDTGKKINIHSKDELGSLSKSINMMADAIEDKIKRLRDSVIKEQSVVREQTILNELMSFIASGVDLEVVIPTFLGRTRDLLKAEHSAIFILENPDRKSEPELKRFLNTFEEETSMDCARAMLNGIFKNTLKTFTPLRTNKLSGETPSTHFEVRNMLAIPLSSVDKKIFGLIVLVNKKGDFTQEDEDTLLNFSFQAFQAITLQHKIVRYATTDGLTGLYNYRVFIEKLNDELERAKRYPGDVSVLMIDIDHFKSFNDIYGHQSGDQVLRDVAAMIHKNIRNTDFAARYGGEEFAVILPETTASQAYIVAERLRSSIINHTFILENKDHAHVTVSIGLAAYPDDADGSAALTKRADQGLYLAKESGRNRVCRYHEISVKAGDEIPEEIRAIMQDVSLSSIKEMAKAIDAKSNYMRGHSFEVAAFSAMLAKELGLTEDQIVGLRIASLLHDIGNLGVSDNILNKPGALSEEEKKVIQGHPGLSEMVLKSYPRADFVLPAILYHHERFDGKGYPTGLKEDEIPLPARILGVVEAYQAMISSRPYRKRKTRQEAIAELEREAGKQFDPMVVKMFINLLKKSVDPSEKRKDKDKEK
ncbi:MAG: diguanylate cyclase [Nitrospirota bacterium]